MTFELSYPPSVNHYWKAWRGRVVLGAQGRAYRKAVAVLLAGCATCKGSLQVHIRAMPPDHRRRDLDNLQKAVLDAMQHAGLYEDDYQICDLRIERGPVTPGGLLVVTVEEVEHESER